MPCVWDPPGPAQDCNAGIILAGHQVSLSAGLQQLCATLCSWNAAGLPLACAVGKLTRLTDLRLSNSQSMQDQELAALLSNLSALQRLELAECYKLTATGVQTLDFPLHLTALQLSRLAVFRKEQQVCAAKFGVSTPLLRL